MSQVHSTIGAREQSSLAPWPFVRPWVVCLLTLLVLCGCRSPEAKDARQEARQERRLKNGRVVPAGEIAISDVSITGPKASVTRELENGIATRASTSFLWTKHYELFDEKALEKDLERIEREMRRRGYYEAKVTAARIIRQPTDDEANPPAVKVEIEVIVGRPVTIGHLETEGLSGLPFDAAEAALRENRLRKGDIFDEDEFEAAKSDVFSALTNRGYAFAHVVGHAEVDIAEHRAKVTLVATPGPRARLGEVTLVGLERLSEKSVRNILRLEKGDVYSSGAIKSARSALVELGVFSRLEFVPDLSQPETKSVPLLVRVEEAALRDVTLGAGVRLDLLRLAVVGQGSWTHRNFLGGLRKFTVSTRPGLTFFPTSVDYLRAPTNVFAENFATARLEQPGFIESRTRGFLETGYNIYPLLYPLPPGSDPADERVVGYHELTASLGATRNFLGRLFFASLSMNWQANFPFTYQGSDPNNDLINVQVTYPELITNIDLRDDPLQPTRGIYLSNNLQVALPLIKNQPSDVRIHPELRTFFPLDQRRKLVLATRFGIGMVFPQNYGSALTHADEAAAVNLQNQDFIHDQQRLLFRAFYSGGPGSNRGYPFRRVGPQGAVGFLMPHPEACFVSPDAVDPMNPSAMQELEDDCFRPLGGFSLWEASVELRFRAFEKWSFVAFADASDVSTQVARFTFKEPHISVGPGVRYLSPVGPIRVDVGFRVPGLQKLGPISGEPPDVSEVPPYHNPSGPGKWDNQNPIERFSLLILIGEDF